MQKEFYINGLVGLHIERARAFAGPYGYKIYVVKEQDVRCENFNKTQVRTKKGLGDKNLMAETYDGKITKIERI